MRLLSNTCSTSRTAGRLDTPQTALRYPPPVVLSFPGIMRIGGADEVRAIVAGERAHLLVPTRSGMGRTSPPDNAQVAPVVCGALDEEHMDAWRKWLATRGKTEARFLRERGEILIPSVDWAFDLGKMNATSDLPSSFAMWNDASLGPTSGLLTTTRRIPARYSRRCKTNFDFVDQIWDKLESLAKEEKEKA